MAVPWPPMPAAARNLRQAGPMLDSWQIAQAIGRCLHERLVPWLDEAARQQGEPVAPQRPKWIGVWRGETGYPDEQVPRVLVVCRGTTGEPSDRDDGSVWAWWRVSVGALVQASDAMTADRLAALYGAAIRNCVVLHAREHLEQIHDEPRWRGETPQALPTDMERAASVVSQEFDVLAGPVMRYGSRLAPAQPDLVGPDDQGDQTVIIATNLDVAPSREPPISG